MKKKQEVRMKRIDVEFVVDFAYTGRVYLNFSVPEDATEKEIDALCSKVAEDLPTGRYEGSLEHRLENHRFRYIEGGEVWGLDEKKEWKKVR